MTREYPLEGEPKTDPPEKPLWEGMLQDGDLLYMPRGWWHVAVPMDEPTLHLTIGIHRSKGVDFLSWYSERLRANAAVRRDLPRLGTAAEKEAFLREIHQAWEQAWHPGILEEYFAHLDSRTQPRPHFGLPWTAKAALPDEQPWSLKWLVPRPIEWDQSLQNGSIVARCNGKEWTFATAARPVLEALQQTKICSLDALCESTRGTLTRERLSLFAKELVDAGLASIVVNEKAA